MFDPALPELFGLTDATSNANGLFCAIPIVAVHKNNAAIAVTVIIGRTISSP
jgi:hypothetical protein